MDRVSHGITTNGSWAVPRVEARTYTASFDEAGLHFSPRRRAKNELESGSNGTPAFYAERPTTDPGSGDVRRLEGGVGLGRAGESRRTAQQVPNLLHRAGAVVTLRTRSVRCGERVVYERSGRPLKRLLYGNTAQVLLEEQSGLVEHVEALAQGLQVSWILKARPAGGGPLEIELETEGLSYAGTIARGIHLADGAGTLRVRIGKATAVDDAVHRGELAMTAKGGRVYVRVPQELLAEAVYPLAIDPLISPEFGMDAPVAVPESGFHYLPAVAWNGTNWLVVWTEWHAVFDIPVDVVAARVSTEGRVLDPVGILVVKTIPPPGSPAVASNGRDFLVVWQDFGGSTMNDIYGAGVTAEGQVKPKFAVNAAAHATLDPSVAANSEGYVVVWQDQRNPGNGSDIYGTRVSNEGTVLDPGGYAICAAPGGQGGARVASGPGGFLAVWGSSPDGWTAGYDLFGTRLDTNGMVLDTNAIAICTVTNYQGPISVAGGSTGYLVAWQDSRSTGNAEEGDIYATLVSPEGAVSHPEGIAISTASGNQTRPWVAAGPTHFLVVWEDQRATNGGIYASRVSPSGVVLDPGGVVVDPSGESRVPQVAPYDGGFLVVWYQPAQGIVGARVDTQGGLIDPKPLLITRADNSQTDPAVASNGAGWLVVWVDNRDPATSSGIYGVRIDPDGRVLDPAALAINTQPGFRYNPAVASAGGDYLVVWPANYDIYGARVRGDGKVLDPAGIPICTAAGYQDNPAITSDGIGYGVAWQDERGAIYAARVDTKGAVLDPDGFRVSPRWGFTPAVASNGAEFLVVWAEGLEREANIAGARIRADGIVLDPNGLVISTNYGAQMYPAVASNGRDFLVIWSTSGSVYGARVSSSGSVLDPSGFVVSSDVSNYVIDAVDLAFNGNGFLAVWNNRYRGVLAAWLDPQGTLVLTDIAVNPNTRYRAAAASQSNSFLVVSQRGINVPPRVFANRVTIFDPPLLRAIRLADGVPRLSWSAEPGRTYRVQLSTNLRSGSWANLDPLVTATNFEASITDSTFGFEALRFYRVLRLR